MGLKLPKIVYVEEEAFEESKKGYSRDSSHMASDEDAPAAKKKKQKARVIKVSTGRQR